MADKLRVGVLGLTHDHIWGNLRDLNASPLGELVAAADPNQELLDKVQAEHGAGQVFLSYEEMLDSVELDAVYVFSDNATGAELAVMAAERGLHVMVEKPMAADLEGAVQMLAAARQAGVKLMVNWPFAWWPQLQKALEMARSGAIGQVFSTKYRSAHAGPKELGCTPYFYNWLHDADLNGAGALMDYCCYGAALARTVLGQPSRVTGVVGHLLKDYVTVDDNAVIVMQWPRAIAITEASWTQIGHLTSYVAVLYGSEGTLVVEPRNGGRLLLADREHEDGVEIEVPPSPEELRNATAYFLHCIRHDRPIEGLCSPEVSRDAQEILEAGLLSASSGEAVSLPLPVY
ncbi:Gfo/Idh/MocA family oxidoreductase [Litorilinea aerophila]|uniref:Gfo/Idh/MocA family oxidoreductase n=1 Tax=Litorilinea aerophila TaxID=1204385 RepID=A0A540VE82_9CHLR|nr:Gfo/Idh/MocA family oxidoreductase [Litorilinea aerophila]MCC9077217.1 Gfo/Idh/MocA family oxidoreductase [Litorilinea aerophila]OUC06303.1 oxidoreductase [Litorilinea aerophila]